ncbi:MAG: DUF1127 domain-containing protein [Rhodobacteraceae bacterium]|nr:DUF1127 domain-containing protein [Paracoccaceae bacterium]
MAIATPKQSALKRSYFGWLAHFGGGVLANLVEAIIIRRTQHDLRALSDRELNDIGLTRDQIEDPAEWPAHRLSSDARRW